MYIFKETHYGLKNIKDILNLKIPSEFYILEFSISFIPKWKKLIFGILRSRDCHKKLWRCKTFLLCLNYEVNLGGKCDENDIIYINVKWIKNKEKFVSDLMSFIEIVFF